MVDPSDDRVRQRRRKKQKSFEYINVFDAQKVKVGRKKIRARSFPTAIVYLLFIIDFMAAMPPVSNIHMKTKRKKRRIYAF